MTDEIKELEKEVEKSRMKYQRARLNYLREKQRLEIESIRNGLVIDDGSLR